MLTVSLLHSVAAVEQAIETDGLTTELLRAIPIADARRRIRELGRAAEAAGDEMGWPLPSRLNTHDDWCAFAVAYVETARQSRTALDRMSRVTGISKKTLSTRVTRARERGYLVGNELGPRTREDS